MEYEYNFTYLFKSCFNVTSRAHPAHRLCRCLLGRLHFRSDLLHSPRRSTCWTVVGVGVLRGRFQWIHGTQQLKEFLVLVSPGFVTPLHFRQVAPRKLWKHRSRHLHIMAFCVFPGALNVVCRDFFEFSGVNISVCPFEGDFMGYREMLVSQRIQVE